jgi:hypothetical protein
MLSAVSDPLPALRGPLAGRYRLDSWLGGGAMGDVYAAEDLTTGETVAVKLMSERHRGRPDALERFRREARAARRIGHEGVVAILDFGAGSDGPPFLVMELLRGESLDCTLDREVRLPWPVVRSIGAQLADALQAAHDLGVIHRDLKPSNCFVVDDDGRPRVKILDFGLAKLNTTAYDARLELTSTGVTLGTLRYMAPEQARDPARVDARADLYSLGVILFRSLTGAAPIRGDNELHFLNNLLNAAPRRLGEAASDLAWPAELEALFARALAKLPDDRFPDAHGLAAALLAIGPETAPIARPAAVVLDGADEPSEVDAFDATARASSSQPRHLSDPARLLAQACERVAARASVYVDHRAAWDADEFPLPGGIRLCIVRGDPILADEAALLCPVQESGAGPRSFVRRVCEFGGPAVVADLHAQRALLSGHLYPIRSGRLATSRVLLGVMPDEAIGLLRIRELCARFAAQGIGYAERQGLASLAIPAMFQGALGGGRQAGIVAFVAAFGRALLSVPCESLRVLRLFVSDSGEALVRAGGELTLDLSAVTSSPLERTQRFVLGRYSTMRALGAAIESALPPGESRELHLVHGDRALTPAQFLDDRTSPAAAGLKHGSRLVLVAS